MPLALVTGGARRLGARIAARLAEGGYDLALHSRSGDAPEDWLTARLDGRRCEMFVADLDDADAVTDLPRAVAMRFGRPIDLLVNCASRFAAMEGAEGAYHGVIDHLRTNLAAPVALAAAVAEAQAGSAIVNILDQRIANPPVDQLTYTLSKQALAEATRTLAVALAPRARVNGVAPGLVLPTEDYAPGQVERVGALMPLGRNARAEEVADAVFWLAQAQAVTGQVIFVDGGAHLKSFERDFVHLARD
ncbi:SDR family oxidoreductase [Sphingomonas sp. Leaf33]|uniref:SDR family oxidoreductase n=1 Tax=Sphingomonas sp. Leaf33 TaxID=1736215 RepID=UPI000A41DB55|nr:SDR family oxidoreductase [Sphingomonas sp. Leaf33]